MRFFGKIGFIQVENQGDGIYEPSYVERDYGGVFNRKSYHVSQGESVIDDISLSNEISVFADSFIYDNLSRMAYVVIDGNKWKISSVELRYPRIIVRSGGVFNG